MSIEDPNGLFSALINFQKRNEQFFEFAIHVQLKFGL